MIILLDNFAFKYVDKDVEQLLFFPEGKEVKVVKA
jgi:hypothetical protein